MMFDLSAMLAHICWNTAARSGPGAIVLVLSRSVSYVGSGSWNLLVYEACGRLHTARPFQLSPYAELNVIAQSKLAGSGPRYDRLRKVPCSSGCTRAFM